MSLDDYTNFLHEARGVIRDLQIHRVKAVDKETTREVASRLGLPARLKKSGRRLGLAAGIIGIAGAVRELAIGAAIAGGIVGIVSEAWSGGVGRTPARVRWLRWALEWDLEQQASEDS